MTTRRRLAVDERIRMRSENWPEAVTPISQLMVRIYRVAGLIHAQSMALAATRGLSLAEFEVLVTLRSVPPPYELAPTDLYGAVLMSSGGLTKVLHGLEKSGLIARIEGKSDRRSKPVRLTAKGRALAERAMADVLQSARKSIMRGLSETDIERLTQLLRKLLAVLEGGEP
ncbi:MAG: MarR family transcriptional regulator [Xanthobacteraceae bacterium]|nr:MarR family transcriptional regulator [Xanthobacteraceae bacterium]